MKLLHTTMLNTQEFNKVSNKIIESLYELSPEIRDLYNIHINYIEDSWQIDFLPINSNLPVLKVTTYTEYDNSNREILRIEPSELEDFPKTFNLKDKNKSYDQCVDYMALFDFIVSLYDFEYTF